MSKVELRQVGTVAVITLNRPEQANAWDLQMAQEFQAVVAQCGSSDTRAVVLTGTGKNFCFGGDLRSMVSCGADRRDYLRQLTHFLHSGMSSLARLAKPVIAAVNGTAAGAGIGLVAITDLAYCASSSKFRLAYAGVGLTPDAGTSFLLPRLIGHRRTLELLYLNRALSAEEALSWGLVNGIHADSELLERTIETAQLLAGGPREAFATAKRLVGHALAGLESHLIAESEGISAQSVSTEGQEGITAFLEKRTPRFD